MERAGSFTAVPGRGHDRDRRSQRSSPRRSPPGRRRAADGSGFGSSRAWSRRSIAGMTIRLKARRLALPLASGPARKFALAFLPPSSRARRLTVVLVAHGAGSLLPGTWLLLYGTAVTAAGALSVRIVPLMGAVFMALGVCALAVAPAAGNAFDGRRLRRAPHRFRGRDREEVRWLGRAPLRATARGRGGPALHRGISGDRRRPRPRPGHPRARPPRHRQRAWPSTTR